MGLGIFRPKSGSMIQIGILYPRSKLFDNFNIYFDVYLNLKLLLNIIKIPGPYFQVIIFRSIFPGPYFQVLILMSLFSGPFFQDLIFYSMKDQDNRGLEMNSRLNF